MTRKRKRPKRFVNRWVFLWVGSWGGWASEQFRVVYGQRRKKGK